MTSRSVSGRLASILRGPTKYIVGLLVVLGLLEVGIQTDAQLYMVGLMSVYALAAVGLNIIFGLGGMLSLAQAGVMAVGGYASALLMTDKGWTFLPAVVVGSLLAAAVSAFASLAALRIATHYFVLVTLAIGESIVLILVNGGKLTGGFDGLYGIPSATIGPIDFSQPWPMTMLTVALLFVGWYIADAFRSSKAGFAAMASNADPQLAMASGINIPRIRILAGTVGGGYAGVAGAVFAELLQFLGPSDFGVDKALLLLLIVVIGGLGSNAGTIVAAVLLTYLSQGLLQLRQVGPLVYGVGIMVILIAIPNGLVGLWDSILGRVRDSSSRERVTLGQHERQAHGLGK